MINQSAPCVDEESAAKLILDAQIRKEREHAKTLLEKSLLCIDANETLCLSSPNAIYGFYLNGATDARHCSKLDMTNMRHC